MEDKLLSVLDKKNGLLVFILGILSSVGLYAQDPNFAQFYVAPTFLNPAFAGATPHYRLSTLYRNQWPSIPNAYESNIIAFDYNWDYYSSGISLMASNDRVLDFGYHNSSASIAYAYVAPISKSSVLRFGLQAGYVLRSIGFNQLTFADQFATGGQTAENIGNISEGYLDISAGALFYSKGFWAGVSLAHLTEPSLQLINEGIEQEFLPMQLSVHLGGKFTWEGKRGGSGYFQPALTTYWQQGYARADVGFNIALEPFVFGGWYRNIALPINEIDGLPSTATVLAGIKKGYFTLAYSYDLGGGGLQGQTGGAHEISITISPTEDYRYKGKRKWQLRYVECPVSF